MKATKTILFSLGVAATAIFAACGTQAHDDDNPTGSWTASAPESVTASVPGASTASKTLSFDFVAPTEGTDGQVTLVALYDVTAPTDSVPASYTVTASIKGTWTQDSDDHDDYLLTFDTNTLAVSGADAPELGPVTDDFLNSLAQYTTIEDVEVSKDGTHMTFEVGKPEVKLHFIKK